MNAAFRRHYDAIHQLARDEWPPVEQVLEDNRSLSPAAVVTAGAQGAER